MAGIVEVEINGEPVFFEVDNLPVTLTTDTEEVGNEDIVARTAASFQSALNTIYLVVSATVNKVREFDRSIAPDEFELQFGVKISGEYGAVVAKAGGEAQLNIKLTFKHHNRPPE